jgi:sensor domain CHASE-containing protein
MWDMIESQPHHLWDKLLITGIMMVVLGLGILLLQAVDLSRTNRSQVDVEAALERQQTAIKKSLEARQDQVDWKLDQLLKAVKVNEAEILKNRARTDVLLKGAGHVQ